MSMVLVGVRGAGKSTLGRALAARRGADFVDLDTLIEAQTGGRSVAALFAELGEAGFRALETRALCGLTERDEGGGPDEPGRLVLATGGGAVLAAENRARLRQLGLVVWLEVQPELAWARCAGGPERPALTAFDPLGEARAVAARRAPLYREVARRIVRTDDRSLDEVCDELEQLWDAFHPHHLR